MAIPRSTASWILGLFVILVVLVLLFNPEPPTVAAAPVIIEEQQQAEQQHKQAELHEESRTEQKQQQEQQQIVEPQERKPQPMCRTDFINVDHETNKAQLNELQRTWIATTMAAYSDARGPYRKPVNVLVWGLGFDSYLWYSAHCKAMEETGGKLAFIEHNQEWIEKVLETYPFLNVHHHPSKHYSTTVATAKEFLTHPKDTLVLPDEIQNTCWDVVLVDAPPGYSRTDIGRQEATWWTMQMTRRCHQAGHEGHFTIFLHDVNRPVEKEILQRLLLPFGEFLGEIEGTAGNLKAVRVRAPKAS